MITLKHLDCYQGDRLVLKDFTLSLEQGCVALIGPNGAGKSTLLHLLADGGRYWPKARIQGELLLDGEKISTLPPIELARRRAFLQQHQPEYLQLPVRDLLCLATWPHGGKMALTLYEEAIQRWQLGHLTARPWLALSGGERQRAQLARTWMQIQMQPDTRKRIWLLDEPQNSLDLPHQQELQQLLRQQADTEALVVFSTHDINFALRTADRILAISQGQLVADASPTQITEQGRLQNIFGVSFTSLIHPKDGKPWLLPD